MWNIFKKYQCGYCGRPCKSQKEAQLCAKLCSTAGGPGTPLGRLKAIADFCINEGLCSGLEAKAPEAYLIEAYEELKDHQDAYLYDKDKAYFIEEIAIQHLLEAGVLFANSRKYVCIDGKTIKPETLVLFVNCNDLFAWACADAETVAWDELEDLYNMWKLDRRWGVDKWCCKKRNLKPQSPIIEDMKKEGAWDEMMELLEDNPE